MDNIKQYMYGALTVAVGLLEALPGLLAWLTEVTALTAAVAFIVQAVGAATLNRFYSAGAFILLALLAVGLALAAAWYANKGGVVDK